MTISESDSSATYGIVEINGHLETLEIGSVQSINWLKATYFENEKEIFSDESYKSALSMVKARATSVGANREIIYKRCALVGDCIYYDLCSPDWKIVKITKETIQIIPYGINFPIFARSKNQSQQVEPTLNPDPDALDRFCKLLRVDNTLFKPHIVTMFVESVSVPANVIIGPQGSIKSTQLALIKMLVDPTGFSLEEQLNHLPKRSDDLNLILANNYYVAFDNVSAIDSEQSDIFCKTITGASYSKRKLYTDNELVILKIRRKFGINGITFDIKNGDLQERSIIYNSVRIAKSERKSESKVIQEFKNIQSDVLGIIFLSLQKALNIVDKVESELSELPRMADFAIWGEAVTQSMGCEQGKFIEYYNQELESGIDTLSEATPLIPFLEEKIQGHQEIKDQLKRIFIELRTFAKDNQYDIDLLPKAPNKMGAYIRKYQPLLDQAGFIVSFFKNTEKNSWTMNSVIFQVKKISPVSSVSSLQTEGTDPTEHKLDSFTGGKI